MKKKTSMVKHFKILDKPGLDVVYPYA